MARNGPFRRSRPPDQPSETEDSSTSTPSAYEVIRPAANSPDGLRRRAKAAARAGLSAESVRSLPDQLSVESRERFALTARIKDCLTGVRNVAGETLKTGEQLKIANSDLEATQAAIDAPELKAKQAADERELAAALKDLDASKVEAAKPVERRHEPAPRGRQAQPDPQPSSPAESSGPVYTSPLGWWAKLEVPVLFLVGRGEYGITYLAGQVMLMPPASVASFALAMVLVPLVGGVFLGRWFRWRAAAQGDERLQRRWNLMVPLLGGLSIILVAIANARMREAHVRSVYEAGGGHGFVLQTNFIPWLTVLGVALTGFAFSLSYVCASSRSGKRSVLRPVAAWLEQRRERRAQQRADQKDERQAQQAREVVLGAKQRRVTAAGAALDETKAARRSREARAESAREQVSRLRERLATLAAELLEREEELRLTLHAQAAAGNAVIWEHYQSIKEENQRKARGLVDSVHDRLSGTQPETPPLNGPYPQLQDDLPDVLASVHRIAAKAKRLLMDHGLLHEDEFFPTGLVAPASPPTPPASTNGHMPHPDGISLDSDGAP